MVSVSRAKQILGISGGKLSNDQVETLLIECYMMAEIMFEHFGFVKDKDIDNAAKNTKLKLESQIESGFFTA